LAYVRSLADNQELNLVDEAQLRHFVQRMCDSQESELDWSQIGWSKLLTNAERREFNLLNKAVLAQPGGHKVLPPRLIELYRKRGYTDSLLFSQSNEQQHLASHAAHTTQESQNTLAKLRKWLKE